MYQPPKPKSPQPQPQPKAPQPLPPKPEPKAPPLPQQWQSALTGTLGKSNVTMTLHRSEERLTGRYSYQGRQGELGLEGYVSEDGLTLNMDEKDAKGVKTGHLTLSVRANGIHGIWYPPNEAGTCYGVHLTPQAAPPQPKPSGPQSQPENAKPPQPALLKPAQAANLTGSIGKYGIRMSLSVQEGKLSGSYGYSSKGTETPFAVTGTVDGKGQATFTAGQETFTGTLSQDLKTFKGTWTANGKTLPCELGLKPDGKVNPLFISTAATTLSRFQKIPINRLKDGVQRTVEEMVSQGITSLREIAFTLANIADESGFDPSVKEDLYYKTAANAVANFKIFRGRRDLAVPYLRNPVKFGNHVYANRNGNGNEASGDGYRYRGHGLIQVTGRGNFRKWTAIFKAQGWKINGELPDFEKNPELVNVPEVAYKIAVYGIHNGIFMGRGNFDAFAKQNRISDRPTQGQFAFMRANYVGLAATQTVGTWAVAVQAALTGIPLLQEDK